LIELLIIAVSLLLFAIGVYVAYSALILRTRKKDAYFRFFDETIKKPVNPESLPPVSILIPAYNEAETIYEKLKNISEFTYPKDKITIFVLNDASTDQTVELAQKGFNDFKLNGQILHNEHRTGVNVSYNRAMAQMKSEYVMTTDADAIIPPESLLNLTKILLEKTDVGALAAKMIPAFNNVTSATRTADAYSNSYNSMLLAESAIASTFPGSTSCLLMRRVAYSSISTSRGSSDGNISLTIIRNGFKFLLAPNIVYYEPVTEKIMEQRRQKIRRATRLIQSVVLNRNIRSGNNKNSFTNIIFPLRFLMMTVCPIILLLSTLLFFLSILVISPSVFATLLLISTITIILGVKGSFEVPNFIVSFIIHQLYLCVGLILSYRTMPTWKKIERKLLSENVLKQSEV
jgi:cellulose synthase/poly-beta-1,6-N-acetylglucosamine synthase-like glycosyltransferase